MSFINDLAKTANNVSEIVPKVYDDGLKSPIHETGELMTLIPRAIKAALSPLETWILNKEFNIKETEKLLQDKLSNVDPNNIVSPEAYVAVPAMQAISYCYNSKDLRNLYANLLANAMIKDKKDSVHPAFVEIIKQLSPLDAKVLKIIYETAPRPIIHLVLRDRTTGGSIPLAKNISWITDYPYDLISISIDNLCRQNIISIPELAAYNNKDLYNVIMKSKNFAKYQSDIIIAHKKENTSVDYIKTSIQINPFGESFFYVCVNDL